MYEVWTKDAIDNDRLVIELPSHALASTLVRTLSEIHVGVPVWMEEI